MSDMRATMCAMRSTSDHDEQRTNKLALRLTETERERLDRAADRLGLSTSAAARALLRAALASPRALASLLEGPSNLTLETR